MGATAIGARVRRSLTGRIAAGAMAALVVIAALSGCGVSDSPSASTSELAGVALPRDFPASQVPIIDGTVQAAGGSASEGWNLTVQGRANDGSALDNASTKLRSAGFSENSRAAQGVGKVITYTARKGGKTYTVTVGATPAAAGGPNSLFYEVSAG